MAHRKDISTLDSIVVRTPADRQSLEFDVAMEQSGECAQQQVSYRTLQSEDLDSLRSAHVEMFPVLYEEEFFRTVVNSGDGVDSLAAVSSDSSGNEHLVGFITTRNFRLYECDPVDRELMGLNHKLLENEKMTYILTLGVSPLYRRRGIASKLIEWISSKAKALQSRAVFLHVICCNPAAIALYRKAGFSEMACRENFYYIWNSRQPVAGQDNYDAFLYAHIIDASIDRSLLSLLNLALAPIRDLISCLHSCFVFGSPTTSYFGTAKLPPAPVLDSQKKLRSSGGSGSLRSTSVPPWLLSLLSRKKALT